jgi:hypothetical protein
VDPVTVSFADGDTAAKTITVSALPDSAPEPNETVILGLTGSTGGAALDPATSTVTILDDDGPGTLALSPPASARIAESGGSTTVQVTRTGGSVGAVGATVSVGGTAGAGDRTVDPVTVSFADGDTAAKTITVSAAPDANAEGDETVILSLTGATGGAALDPASRTVTIVDGAAPGTLALSPPAIARIGESGGSTTMQVTRTGGSVGAVGATIGVGGTAGAGDRTVDPVTVSFADGDTAPRTVTVTATPDALLEPDETVDLSIAATSGGAAFDPAVRTVTIVDGTPPPVLAQPPLPTPPGVASRVTSTVASAWRARRGYTTVTRLAVNRVPAQGTVLVRCRGRGCPFVNRSLAFRTATPTRSLAGLFNFVRRRPHRPPQRVVSRLRVGTTVEVRIVVAGRIGRFVTFRMRSLRRPFATSGCLAVGTNARVAC